MGFNFSRPQYEYSERRSPSEYFRVCDPSDCFCGERHYRRRHVAVQRLPGGREIYRDPSEVMNSMLYGQTYANPAAGMMPGMMSGTAPMGNAPLISGGGNIYLPSSGGITNGLLGNGWPAEWKDPREWTTRDYDRLGEVMDEYLNRQRGRGLPVMFGQGLQGMYQQLGQSINPLGALAQGMFSQGSSPLSPSMLPISSTTFAESPWDYRGRESRSRDLGSRSRYSKPRPSYYDLDELREQMARYAQEAKDHMQSVNDFLYGSERELREERYKDKQRKMIEEILKGFSGRNNDRSNDILQQANGLQSALPPLATGMQGMGAYPSMAGMGGMPGMQGMPPAATFMGANPMAGMYPAAVDPMGAYAGMEAMPSRGSYPRQRRPPRNLGFAEDLDSGGAPGGFDEFGGRRGRRPRRGGFNDPDDDMMDMGDGMYVSSGRYSRDALLMKQ